MSLSGWEDVVPVPQDDGPAPVASIQYASEYARLMGIFRAVLQSQEKSIRVIDLTTELLAINAGNYTVWQYRRECLRDLPESLAQELKFLEDFAEENPKNYQIWYHRRAVVELVGDGHREKDFCDRVFQVDAKNYHAWAHRQWTVKAFNLWEGEMEMVESLLTEDIRNNSAWNHRWFVIHGLGLPVPETSVISELKFVWEAIDKVQLNESAWNYLRGLMTKYPFVVTDTKQRCIAILTLGKSSSDKVIEDESREFIMWSNPFALNILADIYNLEATFAGYSEAARLYGLLQQHDAMRIKTWRRKQQAAGLAAEVVSSQSSDTKAV